GTQHDGEASAPSFEEARFKLAAESEDLAILGDRVLLDRIVANLLDNALVYAPGDSSGEIHAARRGAGIAICFDDAGPGIPEADRERVFDRFARLAGESAPGHGLGLSPAPASAAPHRGTLSVARSTP